MPVESFVTAFQTTLSAAITGTGAITLSLAVALPTLSPAGGQLRVLINSEIILIPAGSSGSSIAIPSGNRGIEGTAAATHANGATVTAIVTAAGLTNLHGPGVDTYANLPAAGVPGRMFAESDGIATWIDDGSAWHGRALGYPITAPPALTGWTALNIVGGSIAGIQRGSAIALVGQPDALHSDQIRGYYRARPGTTWTITALFTPMLQVGTFPNVGLFARNSSSGKLAFACWSQRSSGSNVPLTRVELQYWNVNAYVSNPALDFPLLPSYQGPVWWQLKDDGTNLTWNASDNGFDWYQVEQVSRTGFDASGADQVGFAVNTNNNAGRATGMTIYSWLGTSP